MRVRRNYGSGAVSDALQLVAIVALGAAGWGLIIYHLGVVFGAWRKD